MLFILLLWIIPPACIALGQTTLAVALFGIGATAWLLISARFIWGATSTIDRLNQIGTALTGAFMFSGMAFVASLIFDWFEPSKPQETVTMILLFAAVITYLCGMALAIVTVNKEEKAGLR
jgi:hypothetical protein